MTAVVASLFALAAACAAWVLLDCLQRFGPAVLELRSQLRSSPDSVNVQWKMIERVTMPPLATLRKRRVRVVADRSGLEWPLLDVAA